MRKKGAKKVLASVRDFPVTREVGGFVTVSLAAEMLGLKLNAIYYHLRTGALKGVRLDERTWLVRRSSVERYAKERQP